VILEGIVTTLGPDGRLNVAPMGPMVEGGVGLSRFVLRPFRTSTTYCNLKACGEGVFHVTDDVLLFARAIIGDASDAPSRSAERVRGRVLTSACRYEEFRVSKVEDEGERATFTAISVHSVRLRDFDGFNRAKNLVIEAAILASRAEFLPPETLLDDLPNYRTVVHKTGGAAEIEALDLLEAHIRAALTRRGLISAGTFA
jgi:hypothetical protein